MDLRHHQKNCIDSIRNHFKNNYEGLIKMFCGSGKSFVIYHSLLEFGHKLSVVVVPSINLITQFNEDYFLDKTKQDYNYKYFNKDFGLLTICSRNEIDKKIQKDLKFTTNKEDIEDFLNKKKDKIILITYQSLDILFNVVKANDMKINLLCFDEAHHILGDGIKNLLFGEDNVDEYAEKFIDLYVDKTLYFTATPKNGNKIKMYESVSNISIDNVNYVLMDDENSYWQEETHCGDMIFEYLHRDGVNDNILNDFNIRIDLYTEKVTESIFEAISRSILETGNNRILTFHARSETKSDKSSDVLSFSNNENKKKFIECFNKVIKNEFPESKNKYKNIEFKGITANTKNKFKILRDFDETSDNDIFILASCRTIGEGIDTKSANMMVFIDPKQSYVDIIQNIGRICRKNKNTNKLSTVLIPAYVDINKYNECNTMEEKDEVIRNEMNKSGDFSGILNTLSALRQEDPYMFELCLKTPDLYTSEEINDNLRKNNLKCDKIKYGAHDLFKEHKLTYDKTKSEKENFKIFSKKINKNVQIITNKVLNEDIYINIDSEKTLHLIKQDDIYIKTNGNYNKKLEKVNRNIKPHVHVNDEIKILWQIERDIDLTKKVFGGYIKSVVNVSKEEKWMEMLDKIKKYIDCNNKKPSSKDDNKDIRYMAKWMYVQYRYYAINKHTIKNNYMQNHWNNFIIEYNKYFLSNEEQWVNTLEKIKKYIDDNNKKPSLEDKDINIQRLGRWISVQMRHYPERKYIMKNNNIFELWIKFIDEYKKYFMKNDVAWLNTLKQVKSYIDKHNTKPSSEDKNIEIKKLGCWIIRQNRIYIEREEIMKDDNIYNIWNNFLKEYSDYFISLDEKWTNMLEKVREYIDKYNKRPSSTDKNINIKQLGQWMRMQCSNYKNNTHCMKNDDIKKQWENFIVKYKDHFISDEDRWTNTLKMLGDYICVNKKKPSEKDDDKEVRTLGYWMNAQYSNYKNNKHCMKNDNIKKQWEKFIIKNEIYFPNNKIIQEKTITKKSVKIKPHENEIKISNITKNNNNISEYQKLTRKMSIQKSDATYEMFKNDNKLWHEYHDNRDFSFKGYDKQEEIPINKIINFLEKKSHKKLKILDLGCGRNLIKQYFKNNTNLNIIGYDYVSYNSSIECDISKLPDKNETVDICIFSQSLMGSNWKAYINEAIRVLRYNGEIIISESTERYDIIKTFINELGYLIIVDNHDKTNRWFYLHVINNN